MEMAFRKLVALLAALIALTVGTAALAEPIRGAGSTFAFPVISKWSQEFQKDRAGGSDFVSQDGGLDYEPVGSVAGMMRLNQPDVDFAATDAPLPSDELRRRGLVQFPVVMGGIAVVVNLDGVRPGQLRLTGTVLADIFQSKIAKWNDPAIKALNPDVNLPDLKISVVFRKDGSGSTFNLTRYLAAVNEDWKNKLGFDTQIKWPAGTGAEGSSGVAQLVQRTAGSIGYVEYGQVVRSRLSYALIQNRAGQFVRPDSTTLQSAAASADWAGAIDFYLHLTDAPGAASYPLAATTFVLMHRDSNSQARNRRTLIFLQHALESGGKTASDLGYVPLPESLVAQVKGYWLKSLGAAAKY
jgi:phosphate transport system substrate-binding protein